MSVNLNTGVWCDFSDSDCKGGDLISLYAKIEGISQGEAYRRLAETQGFEVSDRPVVSPPPPPEPAVCMPPVDAPECEFSHPRFGTPSMVWPYLDESKNLMFYIARYDSDDGKQIVPWSWSVNGGWIMKGWPAPRPLYGLDLLAEKPSNPVLVVEGEKSADAARTLLGHIYCVISWPNGAQALKKADWTPLKGRKVLLWADADMPGVKAMHSIADILSDDCPQIKLIDPDDKCDGWDAADAVEEGWTTEQTIEWAKSCVKVVHDTSLVKAVPEPDPEPETDEEPRVTEQHLHLHKHEHVEEIEPEPSKSAVAWFDVLGIATNGNGTPIYNASNARRVIRRHERYKDKIWYDEFHQKIFVAQPNGTYRPWKNEDSVFFMIFMQDQLGLHKISKDMVYDAAVCVAKMNPKNEPKDWMNSLVWDGEERLERMFSVYYGADDSEYMKAVGHNWLIGVVARIFQPGCQQDHMIILEGPQGIFKTRSLRALGGKWYSSSSGSPDSKDFFMNLHGKMIVEIKELDTFRKAEDTLIKKLLDETSDFFRPPYGTVSEDFPRQCVFAGTTNEEEYLKDQTGGRRFWPIRCYKIDLDALMRDRDQLFAEAVHRYKAGETWWEMPESTLSEQETRRMSDEWENSIRDYLIGKSESTMSEIAVECLKIDIGRFDLLAQRRMGKILRGMKWKKHNLYRDGKQCKVWISPDRYGSETPDF